MKWSWKIARLAGIDVYMHWTFLLLLAWVGGGYLLAGQGASTAIQGIAFVLAIFACVVLHELGHALAARRYGIETRDITLLPIGGVARLERMPRQPRQELWVALAGPMVNVVIAASLYAYLAAAQRLSNLIPATLLEGSFLVNLMWVNVVLVLFNLLPAFPMDGGRVLRALLATRLDYTRATDIAATIGQLMAILFGIAGVFWNPFLLFIALFVYLGAEGEARMVHMKSILSGVPVRDAMMTRYITLSPDDTLRRAADELLAGYQQDFHITVDRRMVGLLRRSKLVESLREFDDDTAIGVVMETDIPTVDVRDMLDRVANEMRERGTSTVPVLDGEELVGMISTENVGEMLMVRAAYSHAAPGGDPEAIAREFVKRSDAA